LISSKSSEKLHRFTFIKFHRMLLSIDFMPTIGLSSLTTLMVFALAEN